MTSRFSVAAILASFWVACSSAAWAVDERSVYAPDGTEMFRVRFFDVGDGKYLNPPTGLPAESTWNLSDTQKRDILTAAAYWAEVLKPAPGAEPTLLNVGTFDIVGAMGTAAYIDEDFRYTASQRAIQGHDVPHDELAFGSHGQFVMGRFDYAEGESLPSQIALRPKIDIPSVATHEIGHTLGLMNDVEDTQGEFTPHFSERLTVWGGLLSDDNGNPAHPRQAVLCTGCDTRPDAAAFDTRADGAMLVGPHILDALEGGLPGLPVSMLRTQPDGRVEVDPDYMSHIELRNSLMSHQSFRNYTRLMEAELALVQDLGYSVDRRNFFGRSVYGDGLNIVNDRGFHARNPEGTAYLPGRYNTATHGLGLHVYGSHNHITQTADLLSAGPGGAGIRVDGQRNVITVEPGVRVHALGLNGQGILFAYGNGHELVQRGEVRATGELGVGLRFDMGHNLAGDFREHRGSYMRFSPDGPLAPLTELQGPLVRRVDLTGPVAGSAAALYASPNAYVEKINIMQGAQLVGDIVSHYAQRDDTGALRLTTVSFGQRSDSVGRATGEPDHAFAMRYAGNLDGANLHITLDGGVTALDGHNTVHGMAVQHGATLAGNGRHTLSANGLLRNDGVIAPGPAIADTRTGLLGRIEVSGTFQQGELGQLIADFTPLGSHDVLAVNGTAELDGTLALQAAPGWYPEGWSLHARVIEAAATVGTFGTVETLHVSPTLQFGATALAPDTYRLEAVRPHDAYSRYADDHNARNAGIALRQAATGRGLEPLLSALDFSALDGSAVQRTLGQVSPAIYSAATSASLHHERLALDMALEPLQSSFARATGKGADPTFGDGWQGFATGFGGKAGQSARNDAIGYDSSTYGLVVGATRRLAAHPAIRLGGHVDIAHRSVSPDSPLSGKVRSTAVGIGLQAGYASNDDVGPYAWGGLRVGLEDTSFDRRVSLAGYNALHTADWTGYSGSAVVGAGYRWLLSPGLSAGPLAALYYARVSNPRIDESGPDASRLHIDGESVDALRSSLGLAARFDHTLASGAGLTAHAQATWDREWMNREAVHTATFAAAPEVSFTSRNTVLPRDALALRAGVTYRPTPHMAVSATLTGRTGGGYDAVAGEVQLRWAF